MKFLKLLAFFILSSQSLNINAALIDNGNHTTDSLTGLSWLDLSMTINMSYIDVYTETLFGPTPSGYRIATQSEVATLLSTYKYNVELWDLWGYAPDAYVNSVMYDRPDIDELLTSQVSLGVIFPDGKTDIDIGFASITQSGAILSTALIQTVPVPASIYLLFSGIIGLFSVSRKRSLSKASL